MRCYHFCHYYLSGIQAGIQSAHAQMELFVKYQVPSPPKKQLYHWASKHKTMICLNGGNSAQLDDTIDLLKNPNNPYAWSVFAEDEQSLKSIITNVAIVLPEYIYDADPEARYPDYSKGDIHIDMPVGITNQLNVIDFDQMLISYLRKHRLAS